MSEAITESWLCDETGLSRAVLREFREKNLGAADWHTGQRGMVVWKSAALKRALGVWPELDVVFEKIMGGGDEAEEAQEGAAVVEAIISRKFANSRLVEATASGSAILVRVHDNKNFVAGMPIKARRPKVITSPWILEGRCPRWPGRY